MTTAFQSDAFQNDAFQIDIVVASTETHDDLRPHRKRRRKLDEAALEAFKSARTRLREHIRIAIDGPDPEPVIARLEAFADPQLTDALDRPLVERINYERFEDDGRALEALARDYEAAMFERELQEEEELLLFAS